MERRWLIGLGPPLLAAVALGAVATPLAGAAERAWEPPSCGDGMTRLRSALADTPVTSRPVADAWFTLDPHLDDAGTLAGQRLRLGLGSQRREFVELPAESSAAGPFGRLVLVVADDERRSEVRAIDPRLGCAWSLGDATDVVRDVTLDPGGAAVWEFRVDRATRADLGVWRRPLDGSPPRRVLAPPPDDGRFGPTWSTSLAWSVEADRLTVQSCGQHQCRTRLVDPVTLRARWLDAPGDGQLLGMASGTTVTYAACDALPCRIVSTDVATGARRVVVPAAGAATLATTPDGPRVVAETPAGAEVRRLDGSLERLLVPPQPSLQLVPAIAGGTAGAGLPADWIAWSPDGRSPRDAILTRLSDGRALPVVEVQP